MAVLPEPFDYLADVLPIDPAEMASLRALFVPLTVGRHSILLQQGQPCRHLWFVQRGLLRSYYTTERDEVTCWAALPGDFMTSLTAFFKSGTQP